MARRESPWGAPSAGDRHQIRQIAEASGQVQGRPYFLLTGGTDAPFDRPCENCHHRCLKGVGRAGTGGCVDYDSGLRAHGRFRCPVSCRKLVTGPIGPASSEYVPEDLPKRRTRLLNKADGKNRESENPEEISLLSGRNPTVALEHLRKRFETENRQRGGGWPKCL